MSLRAYQVRALERVHELFERGVRRVLVVMPTGTGKTRTAVAACEAHVAAGGSVLFVAPRRELVDQARAAGVPGEVRTIQELLAAGRVPDATLVVLDEARHFLADAWGRIIDALPNARILGLDATPERADGRGMGNLFEELVVAITTKDAVAQGFLVPAEVIRPSRPLAAGELAIDPVDAVTRHARGSTVMFVPTVELARTYATALRGRGVSAMAVWGDMLTRSRDDVLEAYARGDVEVLVNVNLLTEGWDSPRTETVVLARGFGTAGTYLQAVGRALRPWPGKTSALVIDLPGVSHTHGEPDEERTYSLDGKAIRLPGDELDVRFCPVCGAPTATEACELCGYAGELRKRPPRVLGLPLERFARKRAEDTETKAATLRRWLRDGASRGFKPGWAFAKYRAVYGVAPTKEVMACLRGT